MERTVDERVMASADADKEAVGEAYKADKEAVKDVGKASAAARARMMVKVKVAMTAAETKQAEVGEGDTLTTIEDMISAVEEAKLAVFDATQAVALAKVAAEDEMAARLKLVMTKAVVEEAELKAELTKASKAVEVKMKAELAIAAQLLTKADSVVAAKKKLGSEEVNEVSEVEDDFSEEGETPEEEEMSSDYS